MNRKVFLVAGGSGGHVFPAIALTQNIKDLNFHVLTDRRCRKLFENKAIKFSFITSSPLKKNLFFFPKFLVYTMIGFLESFRIFLIEKPDVVLGFGGYTCFSPILTAKILSIPIILHEQNSVMGKANRFLSFFANKIALSYKKTKFSKDSKSTYTGLPIRKIFFEAFSNNLKNKKIKILILGGSQGASVFSKIFPEVFKLLNINEIKKLSVVQQARLEDISRLQDCYKLINLENEIKNFFNDVASEMKKADIIITRCGASSLAEIESLCKFSFLFPLPNSKDNHQYENGKQFSKKNSCILIDEKKINIIDLKKKIEEIVFIKKSYILDNNNNNKNNSSYKMLELINKTLEK